MKACDSENKSCDRVNLSGASSDDEATDPGIAKYRCHLNVGA